MKRPLTLIATIISTALVLVDGFIQALGMLIILDLLFGLNAKGVTPVVVISAIIVVLLLLAIVFNVLSGTLWAKENEVYKKRKWILITTWTINFLLITLYVLSFALGRYYTLGLITAIVLVVANALTLTDYFLEKKRELKQQNSTAE